VVSIPRITRIPVVALAITLLLSSACGVDHQSLARYDSGTISVADLDEFLLSLPERSRNITGDTTQDEFLETNLRRLAFERIITHSPSATAVTESPDFKARMLWQESSLLAGALERKLASEISVSDDDVAMLADEMTVATNPEPIFNFRHIFFRIDPQGARSNTSAVRARAEQVRRRAASGENFDQLAREYSQSSVATDGGLIQNIRPRDVDNVTARALLDLEEGEVSPVVETTTGLHIFKLERRIQSAPPSREEFEQRARRNLFDHTKAETGQALLADLRRRVEIQSQPGSLTVGSWSLNGEELEVLQSQVPGTPDDPNAGIIDQLLLADEARRLGLDTPELDDQIAKGGHLATLTEVFTELRLEYCAAVPEEDLRTTYDAQPSRWMVTEQVHLDLIFVPRGPRPFETQTELEVVVNGLRAGASFSDTATRISRGPGAEDGGDLGVISLRQCAALGPQIHEAVQKLAAGEISDPIFCTDKVLSGSPTALRGGFAIIRIRERFESRARSLEEAIDDVRNAHCSSHRNQFDRKIIAEVLDEHSFEILRLPTPEELQP